MISEEVSFSIPLFFLSGFIAGFKVMVSRLFLVGLGGIYLLLD